jgi:hypothetical protein
MQDEVGGAWNTNGKDEKCMQTLVEKPKGRDHLKYLGADGDNIEMDLGEIGREAWIRFMWFSTESSGAVS